METTTTDWRDHAACLGQDPELFYPNIGEERRDAITICRTCPVTTQCLQEALDFGDRHGIWGATTPNDRTNLVRRAVRKGNSSPVRRQRS
jgi:WhiB family redox-sensing transcriptional regulator